MELFGHYNIIYRCLEFSSTTAMWITPDPVKNHRILPPLAGKKMDKKGQKQG